MKNKIINFIRENSLGSSVVSDAINKKGWVKNVKALNRGKFCVGEVEYLYAWRNSIWYTHFGLSQARENKVVFIDAIDCGDNSVFGHLMARYAFEVKKAVGVVVRGNIRDVEHMSDLPVWHVGTSPVICSRERHPGFSESDRNEIRKIKVNFQDGIMVCDDTGCTIIHTREIIQTTLDSLNSLAEREKLWHSFIGTDKSTFDITCSK